MQFKIEQVLAQEILDYLAIKPYTEVFQLIEKVRRLEKVDNKLEVSKESLKQVIKKEKVCDKKS